MNNYTTSSLGALARVINGRAYKQEELLDSGKYRVLRVGNFFSNGSWYYSDLELDKDKYCESGDLLFAWSASFGPKIWDSEKVIYHYHIWKIVENSELIDRKYLYYFLLNSVKGMMASTHGSIMLHLTKEFMDRLPVHLPNDVRTQKNIADVLSSIDAKIDCNNRINSELESMAKMLYDYWFIQFDFPDSNGRPYKSSGGMMVYDDILKREIPVGWNSVRINDLLSNQTESVTSSAVKDDDIYTPIDSLPIRKMSFGYGQSSAEANTSLIRYKCKDILIGAMRVYFHRVCIAPFDGITRTTTLVLRPKEVKHLPFLYQVCNEERAIDTASKISVGTQQPYVNWENSFENYMIPYPGNNFLIEDYSSKMEHLIQQVINREIENAELIQLRNWLLPMLMNGQVTVA